MLGWQGLKSGYYMRMIRIKYSVSELVPARGVRTDHNDGSQTRKERTDP